MSRKMTKEGFVVQERRFGTGGGDEKFSGLNGGPWETLASL